MKTKIRLLIASFLALSPAGVFAEPSEEEEDDFRQRQEKFLAVRGGGHCYDGTGEETFARPELPTAVLRMLDRFYWRTEGGVKAASFVGYAIDVNKDGKTEYFIETVMGGSGGPAFMVFSKIDGRWKSILNFQGGVHIVRGAGSWPKLIGISRGGGGSYCKSRYQFEKGRYVETFRENYDNGEITETVRPEPDDEALEPPPGP